jgi:hypothetical protein
LPGKSTRYDTAPPTDRAGWLMNATSGHRHAAAEWIARSAVAAMPSPARVHCGSGPAQHQPAVRSRTQNDFFMAVSDVEVIKWATRR